MSRRPTTRALARRPGHPLAISNPEARTRLIAAITGGVPLTHAALHAGMSERSLFRTLARGEAAYIAQEDEGATLSPDDVLCRDLWLEVRRARSQVAVRNVALVQKAAQGGYVRRETTRRYRDDDGRMVTETVKDYADLEWRAAKWLLEASFGREFATLQESRVEITGVSGGPVQVEAAGPSDAVVESLAARLAAAAEARRREDAEDGEIVDADVVED